MSEWGDDDDFGGFESADIVDDVVKESVGKNYDNAADATQRKDSESAQGQILDWILSNTQKQDVNSHMLETNSSDLLNNSLLNPTEKIESSTESLQSQVSLEESPASISHAEQLKERLSETVEVAKNLDDIFAGTGDASSSQHKSYVQRSVEFQEAQKALSDAVTREPVIQKKIDNETLHKLQSELDTMLIMKEQTERSTEMLRNELKELTEQRKQDLETCKEKHETEIRNLKKQHKDEMDELQKTSEEMVKLITKQYSDVWKLFEKEKTAESEDNVTSIMQKCIEIMEQQHLNLSRKLENDREEQQKEIKRALGEEREDMEKELKTRIEEERVKLENEMTKELQEKMSGEAKRLQELHTSTLQEAMTKQHTHFQKVLETTLQAEREKFADVLKTAVKEAQEVTEKASAERMKLEEKRLKNNNMAAKMLLTSALKHVEQTFSSEPDVEMDDS